MRMRFVLASLLALGGAGLWAQGTISVPGQGDYRWEWATASESPTREDWEPNAVEHQAGCFIAATWFDERMVQLNCPAPFSPYGVTFLRYCVVKPNQRLVRAKVIVQKDGTRTLWSCEVR